MQEYRKSSTEDGERQRQQQTPAGEEEEGFEDVGLNDEPKAAQPKKKGLFARFGDSHGADSPQQQEAERTGSGSGSSSSHLHFNFSGRKRAQSGQGAELKSMPRENGNGGKVVKAEVA